MFSILPLPKYKKHEKHEKHRVFHVFHFVFSILGPEKYKKHVFPRACPRIYYLGTPINERAHATHVRSVQELLHPPTAHLRTTLPPTVAPLPRRVAPAHPLPGDTPGDTPGARSGAHERRGGRPSRHWPSEI